MKREEILRRVDHTLLKQEAVWEEIRALCDDAVAYGVASVCIPPCYVRQAAGYLGGRVPVCTVVGFPNGNTTTAAKVFETREAIGNGAAEIDMVINLGWLRDKKYPEVLEEVQAVKAACGERVLKVIIETCLLTREEKVEMCRIVTQAGADFIKTSTGFSTGGATPGDVGLLAREVGPGVRVKAAGGISSWEDAEEFIRLGASRLGTSRLVKLAKAERT
ncbi:MAG: deoxyribose-phosphate aldolase [Angelakisella sp.]|jgi:deoxyribose-phosphate aldolase|nr:deoxyribose-phosphate aldolase [Angelakisella sp.]MCI9666633.1 deoxyribose-phosphate aldolase [Angelakisella sp.]